MNEQQRQQFIEQMGLVLEAYRLTRTAGRMLGYFLLEGGVHSLDEVAKQLDVSRGSVCTNGQKLCEVGVLRQHPVPGDRRMYYRLTDNPWEHIFGVARRRMERMLETLESGTNALGEDQRGAQKRLEEWQQFYRFMLEELKQKVERWRDRHASAESVSSEASPT